MTGSEFKGLREATGLSVRQAAAVLGVAPSTVFRYEHEDRQIPSEIADALRGRTRHNPRLEYDPGGDIVSEIIGAVFEEREPPPVYGGREYVAGLIRDHGIQAIVSAVGLPAKQAVEGWDLTGWQAFPGAGAVVLARYPPRPPLAQDGEAATMEAEIRALERITPVNQNRINELGHLIRERKIATGDRPTIERELRHARESYVHWQLPQWDGDDRQPVMLAHYADEQAVLEAALAAAPACSSHPPTEAVLWVNASEDRREEFQAQIDAGPGEYPTLLVMRPATPAIPTTSASPKGKRRGR